jgi:site-specific DNA-methyltransferase (adenine-specific)
VTIHNADFLTLTEIPPESIDLTVTSPPYNVAMDYQSGNDEMDHGDYLDWSAEWLDKLLTLTRRDGRLCLNVPLDTNKGGRQSMCSDVTTLAQQVGWQYQSTIIWNEQNISRRTAWGSWLSASAPVSSRPLFLNPSLSIQPMIVPW